MADRNPVPSRHPRADLYRAEREKGRTYAEIARMYGVSKQRVAAACGKQDTSKFREITPKGCVYPNLRDWMNRHKVSRKEFLRRMGLTTNGGNEQIFRNYLQGKSNPGKSYIDRMLRVTGLTYEKLFAKEV